MVRLVNSANPRRAILNLRKDPELSAFMAAEYANENKQTLEKNLGHESAIPSFIWRISLVQAGQPGSLRPWITFSTSAPQGSAIGS